MKIYVRKNQKTPERGPKKKKKSEEQEGISGSEKEDREEEVLQVPEKIFPAVHGGPAPLQIVNAIYGQLHAGANGYY